MSRGITRIDGVLHYNGRPLPTGPWQSEPDHELFEAHGFPCIVHRNAAWCGYVAVPPGHPWHGKGYDSVRAVDDEYVDVHGGLTYAEKCAGEICHVAKPGEPDDVWWLGFDCSHHGDMSLYHARVRSFSTYRSLAYVKAETVKLAAQAKAVR